MSNQMIIRIDPELKDRVGALAKAEGKTMSEVVRELLKEYIRQRDISGYIDDLWDRIGTRMRRKGVDRSRVNKAISQVRAGK
ncbi:MAG: CopG family transcriptional regulator [Deltaproteobacteria bacterium]|nr:ribbon-helix-helix protein, CopG family [Deltaproteobacteria bacterium]MBW2081790.1 ribbon-helix-helix protein, CopG family [Deltaproteobacteria bacterium]RLB78707.1 MAG: CopG family transcriptional regulator [Deltaproteobacteria bacterium]HDM10260.1 ribbon-helix-helix protein, CopG family [Desulfobacteraceae bacterium]